MSRGDIHIGRLRTEEDLRRAIRKIAKRLNEIESSASVTASVGSDGFSDNAAIRANGTGGSLQDSPVILGDDGTIYTTTTVGLTPGGGTPLLTLELDTSAAGQGAYIVNLGTGDAQLRFRLDSENDDFALGMDNSDSNKFKICENASLSSGARLTIDLDGYVILHLETSAPADGSLANDEAAFWYDSTGPSIEVKHKDGGGTVRNGTVASIA